MRADRILRLAFGTFFGLPDPQKTFGDGRMILNRWRVDSSGVLGAYTDGMLVGSNVVTRWSTFGWFGPLSVRPDLWDKGIAKELMGPHHGSVFKMTDHPPGPVHVRRQPKHVGLYQKFDFHARFLTAVMTKKMCS